MRTIAYVDGYNFYHGRIKHTPYKWLDLRALLAGILHAQDPAADLVAVKFFTALIKAPLARLGVQSVNAQQNYHRALGLKGVEVVLGKFTLSEAQAPRRVSGQPADRDDRVDVWHLGEKQTDVKLALSIYRDAVAARCDQIMLVTNDSDLAPALHAVREDCQGIRIGVVLPRSPDLQARRSASLEEASDWTRHHILDEELAAHVLPARVPTRKKPIEKPAHW